MGLSPFVLNFFRAILVASSSQGNSDLAVANQIHPLRPQSGFGGYYVAGVSCLSWRLGVETNNIIGWKTVPEECEGYVGNYLLGGQYRKDSKVVTYEAYEYAKSLRVRKKDLWIFDIDETSLSNLPYYAKHGFGYVTTQSILLKLLHHFISFFFFFYRYIINQKLFQIYAGLHKYKLHITSI